MDDWMVLRMDLRMDEWVDWRMNLRMDLWMNVWIGCVVRVSFGRIVRLTKKQETTLLVDKPQMHFCLWGNYFCGRPQQTCTKTPFSYSSSIVNVTVCCPEIYFKRFYSTFSWC